MKRFALSVVMTGVLGLAAFSLSSAQQPGRRPGGPGGPGGFGGFGAGGPGRGGIGALRGVELTDEQKASIKAIHEAERSARDASGDNRRPAAQAHRELEAEIFADSPDPQKIASLQQQIAQAQSAALAERTSTMQKVAQVLTAEQRAGIRNRVSRIPNS